MASDRNLLLLAQDRAASRLENTFMEYAVAFAALSAMEIVLGIDNIVFIADLRGGCLPSSGRRRGSWAWRWPWCMRILLLLTLSWIDAFDPAAVPPGRGCLCRAHG